MRMVRRLYEEDSSVEDSEDYPLYRTPRLYGGQGPAGEEDVDDPDAIQPDPDSPDEEEDEEVRSLVFPLDTPVSSNNSLQMDKVNFIIHLCDCQHTFEKTRKLRARHKCRGCNRHKLIGFKVQCSQCKMYAHEGCSNVDNEQLPLPCIPATPMANPKKPDLKECTAGLERQFPKVPAILVKCFYELQKEKRISTKLMYESLPTSGKDLVAIEKLSAMLRRHVNRDLGNARTEIISGCVLKFLLDVREQLLSPQEEHYLMSLEEQLGRSEDETQAVLQRASEYIRNFEPHRLHTIAALFLHIRNVYALREVNDMSSAQVYSVFKDVFKPIKVFFKQEPPFWLRMLNVFNEAQDAPTSSAPSCGMTRFVSGCFSRPNIISD